MQIAIERAKLAVKNLTKTERNVLFFFGVLYFLAVVIHLFTKPADTIMYLAIDLGIGAIIFFVYAITKNRKTALQNISNPLLELSLGLMIFHSLTRIFPIIPIEWWNLGEIIRYSCICLFPIWILTLVRRSPLWNSQQSIKSLRKDLFIFVIIFLVLAIPSAFYTGLAQNILSGKIQISWIPTIFSIGFLYSLFSAAIPEEVFFRGFVQSRLSVGFQSKWVGLIISAVFFGVLHTGVNIFWGDGSGFLNSFSKSIFIQAAFGLLYGMLYMRTGSLIPGILLHASGNSIVNFVEIAKRLGLI